MIFVTESFVMDVQHKLLIKYQFINYDTFFEFLRLDDLELIFMVDHKTVDDFSKKKY